MSNTFGTCSMLLLCQFICNPVYLQNTENYNSEAKSIPDGIFNLNGYMLPLYITDNKTGTFKIEHLRLKSQVSINNFINCYLQFDASDKIVLKDASVNLEVNSYFKLRIGQFLYHIGIYQNPWDSPAIFSTNLYNQLFGDPRDLGIQINGSSGKLDYFLFLMNGTARGVSEDDKKKTIHISFDYNLSPDFKIGVSYYNGSRNFQDNDSIISGAVRNRSCFFLWYDNNKILFQFENICGKDHTYKTNGYFILLGYKLLNKTQPFIRYESFNSDITSLQTTRLSTGLNFYLNERLFIKSIFEFENSLKTKFRFNKAAIELGVLFDINSDQSKIR